MPNGSLSLPARLYLLAWDTTRNEVTGAAHLPYVVRAGALTELAQRGLLTDVDGIATPVDMDSRTGDAVLDGLLELVRESRPHRWRSWVKLHARVTLDAVREKLAADGYLAVMKKRVLGVFPSVEYGVERAAVVEALREEARQVLEGPVPVAEVSDRDAAVVTLAVAGGLRMLVPRKERSRHEERVEALTERSGAAAPGLRTVVREVRAGVVAAVSAPSVATGG
ncbi:GPP34 family phosphoprotein [Streptomyces sp. GESEQ-35]|uniref:GOLPH3/VPS74 family protein n=1 Tax=Streptomyces sp. GESEQ-35 TaxID=2812657 RepID=UPI001B33BB74|nr:GPP34 family phosphoprotein [Streptomyces sp. GESEQ-35]